MSKALYYENLFSNSKMIIISFYH